MKKYLGSIWTLNGIGKLSVNKHIIFYLILNLLSPRKIN